MSSRREAAAVLLAGLIAAVLWLGVGIRPAEQAMDAYPTYVAGQLWRQGEAAEIYRPSAFRAEDTGPWAREVEATGQHDEGTGYVYAPLLVPVAAGLSMVLGMGGFAWLVFSLSALGVAYLGRQLSLALGWRGLGPVLLVSAVLALAPPTRHAVHLGQDVILLAAVFLWATQAMGNTWPSRARLWGGLAVASLLKPWAPVLALRFVFERSPRRLIAGVAALCSVLVLSLLLLPSLGLDYLEMVSVVSGSSSVKVTNTAPVAVLLRALDPGWVDMRAVQAEVPVALGLRLAALSAVALVLGLAAWRSPRMRTPRVADGLRCLAAVPLILTVAWTHYLVLALPWLALIALRGRTLGERMVGVVGFLHLAVTIHLVTGVVFDAGEPTALHQVALALPAIFLLAAQLVRSPE